MIEEGLKKLKIPNLPGVYKFISKDKKIIYIGKSKNLKKRISNWLSSKKRKDKKGNLMKSLIKEIEFTVTNNENSALILESEEIKIYKPKFNVLLKDDKSYPYIKIVEDSYPYLKFSRASRDDGEYIGPFSDSKSVKKTISFLEKNFGIRPCRYDLEKQKIKSCIYYQMKQCPAPCEKKIDKNAYKNIVKSAIKFINGEKNNIFEILELQMKKSSKLKNYELAAQYRDKIISLKSIIKSKKDTTKTNINTDLVSLVSKDSETIFSITKIRNGKFFNPLIYKIKNLIFENRKNVLLKVMEQHYLKNKIPKKIIIPFKMEKDDLFERSIFFSKTKIRPPFFKWEKTKMNESYKNILIKKNNENPVEKEALKELEKKLNLGYNPEIIEGFDISNLMGENAVGSQVCYKNGNYEKKLTRNYKIKSVKNIDDPKMIAEVISRRCKKIIKGEIQPDLILIDGGLTQLKAAKKILEKCFLNIPVISIAKKFEKIYSGETFQEIKMKKNSPGHNLLIRVRNDAHRVALNHHKKIRKKSIFN